MNSAERKEVFFTHLDEFYSSKGFSYRKNANCFVKKSDNNEFKISYEIWPEFMQIEPSYQILIKEVEDVKKKAWGKLYKKFCSVGQQRAYLIDRPEHSTSWTDSYKNTQKAINKEFDFWKTKVEGYFSDFSNIDYLNQILNTKVGENTFISFNRINTGFLAIIVAYLCENPKLKEVVEFYSKVVEKDNPAYNEELKLLSDYVLDISISK